MICWRGNKLHLNTCLYSVILQAGIKTGNGQTLRNGGNSESDSGLDNERRLTADSRSSTTLTLPRLSDLRSEHGWP